MVKHKVVFVVDKKYSPLWTAATQHFNLGDLRIVCAFDFSSPQILMKELDRLKSDILIFSWRPALFGIFKNYQASKRLQSSGSKICLLVPDFMGRDHSKTKQIEKFILNKIDLLLLTSEELYAFYQQGQLAIPMATLHDRPSVSAINATNVRRDSESNRDINFIWVGNSEWGKRQGFIDHKGLNRLAIPAFNWFQLSEPSSKLEIIDSALSRIPNDVVLDKIKNADCLIVTSDSEGTCLPILESAGLGTPVVTVKTGIAPEFLIKNLSVLIADRTIESLVQKMKYAVTNRNSLGKELQIRFGEYIEILDHEYALISKITRTGIRKDISLGSHFFSAIWVLRWLKGKLSD